MQPADKLVRGDAWAIMRAGEEYVVYLPEGGAMRIARLSSSYRAQWFNPRDGVRSEAGTGPAFRAPDGKDWVLYIKGTSKN
jgi:hypothetical protein